MSFFPNRACLCLTATLAALAVSTASQVPVSVGSSHGQPQSAVVGRGRPSGDMLRSGRQDLFAVQPGVNGAAPAASTMRPLPTGVGLNAGPSASARSRDPQSWEWRPAAAFAGPAMSFSIAFTIGDKAYVGVGYGGRNELWQYDPGRDTWTRKAVHPGKIRGAAIGFVIGDKGYVGLGYGDEGRFADLWEYDPAVNRWTQKASLPGAVRDHCAAFALGSKAYITSGMTCRGNEEDCNELKEVWEYDPRADRWTRKADMPEAIVWSGHFVLNGKGYIEGSERRPQATRKFWEYDPQADRWTRRADFPGRSRFRAVGFALNGKGYIGTGVALAGRTSSEVLNDLWEYDPQADTWAERPAFSGPARGAAVGFVLGSRVYVGTGMNARREELTDCWWASPPVVPPKGPEVW